MGAIRKNQTVAYKRVSSAYQDVDRQLQGRGFDKEFIEKVSGGTKNRPELNRLIEYVRKGDPVQRLMLQMMGVFAQFERSIIRERQAQGKTF